MSEATGEATAAPPVAGSISLTEWQRMRRDPLGLLESLRPMGDVIYFQMERRHSYLIFHPDLAKDVLVTNHRKFGVHDTWGEARMLMGNGLLHSEGEFHKRQRRMTNPAFHHTRIVAYGDIMAAYADRACRRWQAGQEINIHDELMQVTLAVVCKTLFDTDINEAEAQEFRGAMNDMVRLFRLGTPIRALLEAMPSRNTGKFEQARAVVDAFVYRTIDERRRSGEDRGDLLSMLMLARDEEAGGDSMTDEQLRDEAMTLVAAGHETTANALSWTWYLLAEHPEVEEQLHHELDSTLGGRLPTAHDLESLPYLRAVLNETMRLYPPAWILVRKVVEEHEIGGYRLQPEANVSVFPYILQRDPRWWPEPARFDPSRWASEPEGGRHKYAYIPFGAGPRMCIGENFAWMEASLVVATIAQRWRLRVRPGHRVVPEPKLNLRPRNGIPMIPEPRG